MAEDLRSRLTRQIITNSFSELLQTTPLSKITVSAICAKASINRSTFYRYYENPLQLYESIEDWFFNEIREYAIEAIETRTESESFKGKLEAILRFYKDNYQVVLAMKSKNGDEDFEYKMLMSTFSFMSESNPSVNRGLSDSESRFMYRYMAFGSAAVVSGWLDNNMREPVEDVAEFIQICSSGVHAAFKETRPSFEL